MELKRALELYDMFPEWLKTQKVGDYLLIDYNIASWSMFRDYPETREFRGITFDLSDGSIVSRPFGKFFNVGENDETRDLVVQGTVAVKHDGSLAQITYHNGELFVASRASMIGYVNQDVTKLLHAKYPALLDKMKDYPEYTFLFEFEDVNHFIVLPHKSTRLVLINVRHKVDGSYHLDEFKSIMEPLVDVVETYELSAQEFVDLAAEAEDEETEGFVVYIPEYGDFIKWKTSWYVRGHRVVTEMVPSRWIKEWAEHTLDDLLAYIFQLGHVTRVDEITGFVVNVLEPAVTERLKAVVGMVPAEIHDAKTLAVTLQAGINRSHPIDAKLFGACMALYRSGRDITVPALLIEYQKNIKSKSDYRDLANFLKPAEEKGTIPEWEKEVVESI